MLALILIPTDRPDPATQSLDEGIQSAGTLGTSVAIQTVAEPFRRFGAGS